jgi:hypothetical protein
VTHLSSQLFVGVHRSPAVGWESYVAAQPCLLGRAAWHLRLAAYWCVKTEEMSGPDIKKDCRKTWASRHLMMFIDMFIMSWLSNRLERMPVLAWHEADGYLKMTGFRFWRSSLRRSTHDEHLQPQKLSFIGVTRGPFGSGLR